MSDTASVEDVMRRENLMRHGMVSHRPIVKRFAELHTEMLQQLGAEFGYEPAEVQAILTEAGVRIAGAAAVFLDPQGDVWWKRKSVQLYDVGMSTIEIAALVGHVGSQVLQVLRERGVERRPSGAYYGLFRAHGIKQELNPSGRGYRQVKLFDRDGRCLSCGYLRGRTVADEGCRWPRLHERPCEKVSWD